MKPTLDELEFAFSQVKYGYESHLDWENYFRKHTCSGTDCKVCEEAKLLGDADFHAEQKHRYEIELRLLTWAIGEYNGKQS